MGFNPYRKFTARPADYAMIIGGTAAALALVIWASLA